jgi:hypothetical protein
LCSAAPFLSITGKSVRYSKSGMYRFWTWTNVIC